MFSFIYRISKHPNIYSPMSPLIICGLGNPGSRYEKTRHNIGVMVIDFFREHTPDYQWTAWHEERSLSATVCQVFFNGHKLLLMKPATYMNDSGKAVQAVISYYKTAPDALLVVHDEVDFPCGDSKLQFDRSSAGHNGVKSIIEHIGTQTFHRVRLGVGKPPEGVDTADFVLKPFRLLERTNIKQLKEKGTQLIEQWIEQKTAT